MSTLLLYKTKLSPSLNAKVDNMQAYLSSLLSVYSTTIQYQKINLDLEITLPLDQEHQVDSTSVGNYADIIQDGKHHYYFILKATWDAKKALKLQLSIDSVNTFANDFTWNKKTTIIREHRNRFTNISPLTLNATNTLISKIDKTDEGVNGAIQYKQSMTKIQDRRVVGSSNQPWYLVYRTPEVQTSSQPVDISLYPKRQIILQPVSGSSVSIGASFCQANMYYYFMKSDNPTLIWNSYTWDANDVGIICWKENNNFFAKVIGVTSPDGWVRDVALADSTSTVYNAVKCFVGSQRTYDTTKIKTFSQQSVLQDSTNLMSACIANVDRTLSTLIKIIELPYAPFEVSYSGGYLQLPSGWSINGDLSIKIPFNNAVGLGQTFTDRQYLGINKDIIIGNSKYITRTIEDPKLMHSSYFTYKLAYDSYSITIPHEMLERQNLNDVSYTLDYHQAETITSNLGYKVNLSNATWTSTTDYPNYLIATRNNESPIYTSAYLDYLRNGYNYDRKAQTRSNVATWIAAGASIVGAVVSFAAAGVTGGLSIVAGVGFTTTAISTISSAVNNTVSNEQAIQQKLNETQNQANTINTSDDIDLLNWYNDNKLYVVKYRISDELYNLMNDLFYYCGYATNKQAIPDLNSRTWFNYIQANPVFNEEQSSTYSAYLEDIKARYAAGVTVFHAVADTTNPLVYHWDFEQVKENWETGYIA